jgi:hypothetical protein
MYRVEVDYCGVKRTTFYRSKKEVNNHFYGWYYHGLDMVGQATSTFTAYDGKGNIVISDRY